MKVERSRRIPDFALWLALLTPLSLCCGEKSDFELVLGSSYFGRGPEASRSASDALSAEGIGEQVGVIGVYYLQENRNETIPQLLFCEDPGKKRRVQLAAELTSPEGSLVVLLGNVEERERRFRYLNKSLKYKVLRVRDERILADTREILKIANETYGRLRGKLQEEITPRESKLVLPEVPDWKLYWCKDSGSFVVTTRIYDMMYEANVDLEFDGHEQRLSKVYAQEWFKGEAE